MDHGQLLPHDGLWALRRILALLRHAAAPDVGSGRAVLDGRDRCNCRQRFKELQRRHRLVPAGVGVRALHILDFHAQDQYRLRFDLLVRHSWRLGPLWRILESQHGEL